MNRSMMKLLRSQRAALLLCLAILCAMPWPSYARKLGGGEPQTVTGWVNAVERAESATSERWTVFVQDMATGEVILDHNADQRLIPASNRKIIPFALSLSKLGPEFRFRTELGLTRVIRHEGTTLTGSVILRSNGDPTMQERYLNQRNPALVLRDWIGQLADAGVLRVQGDFIIDASAFGKDQNAHPAAWGNDHINYTYAPHPSAISINDNLLRINASSSSSGNKSSLTLYPSLGGVEVVNRTGSGRGNGLDAKFDEAGELCVTGGSGARGEVAVPIEHPLDFVRGIVVDELARRGITIAGKVRIVTDPAEAKGYPTDQVIASHESPALIELLHVMMRESDNFLAEQIWRSTAFHISGKGDCEGARRFESDWYRAAGLKQIDPGYDGSGLSRMNGFSGRQFVQVLRAVYSSAYRPYLLDCLPTSGQSGTLRGRSMGGDPGRVVAKTGTLDGAQALSGFIRDTSGRERYAFGIVANGRAGSNSSLKNRINLIVKILMDQLDGKKSDDLADRDDLLVAEADEAKPATAAPSTATPTRLVRAGSDDDDDRQTVASKRVKPSSRAGKAAVKASVSSKPSRSSGVKNPSVKKASSVSKAGTTSSKSGSRSAAKAKSQGRPRS